MQLFECNDELQHKQQQPLADKIRPTKITDLVGQDIISQNVKIAHNLQSMILWGPPGCGKTTFAKILAKQSSCAFEEASAVVCDTAKFKQIFLQSSISQHSSTVVLIDEIHHLNKSQQDLFLPYLENGSIILIGTTTENPSFELRPALLSRCKVLVFNRLELEDLELILQRVELFINKKLPITDEARLHLCLISDGDARYLLNRVEEILAINVQRNIDVSDLQKFISKRSNIYSKDEMYNLLSAFHKSLRGSDVDAALYWAERMLSAGENPLILARRLIRFAVEDIGLADPNALVQANAAFQAYNILGSPEGDLAIMQAVVYAATAPKSNASYVAYKAAKKVAETYGSLPVPKRIRNAPTQMMKDMHYNDGYKYDHDFENAFAGTNFFPEELSRKEFYKPTERGFEREIKKRIDWWKQRREK